MEWTPARMRLFREVGLCESQQDFAKTIGFAMRTIGNAERGTHPPSLAVRRALDQVLENATDAQRDRFLAAVTATQSTNPVITGATPAAFPALNYDDVRHLAVAMTDAGRYLDGEAVLHLQRQLTSCMAADGTEGPQRTLPVVLGVVAVIEKQARQVKPDVRRDLLVVGARSAEFAGWLYRDAGRADLASHWRDRAVEWAQEAGDWSMQGYLLLKKSQAAWDERDGLRMLTLAQAAQTGPWTLPARVRAEVAQQEARGLAMIGEARLHVEHKLDQAWTLIDTSTAEADSLGDHYDKKLLTIQTAICYCAAGQPGRAVELYEESLSLDSFSRRDRGYFLSLMAGALARAGEPDAACEAGQEATIIAMEMNSQRTIRELGGVLDTLGEWRARPTVRALTEAVQWANQPARILMPGYPGRD